MHNSSISLANILGIHLKKLLFTQTEALKLLIETEICVFRWNFPEEVIRKQATFL